MNNGKPGMAAMVAAQAQALGLALGVQPSPNEDTFVYQRSLAFAEAATVGTTAEDQIQINADSDFVCTRISATCRVANGRHASMDSNDGSEEIGGWPDLPFTLELRENGSQRSLHDQPVDAAAAYGPAAGNLPRPKVFKASSQIQLRAAILKASAAGTGGFTIRVQLHGYKRYSGGLGR